DRTAATASRLDGDRLRPGDGRTHGISIKKVQSFISAEGWSPRRLIERPDLRAMFEPQPEQLSLL
ncbi:hypothetical protein ACCS78_19035, partial [Rhizobium johnstonii]